LMKAFMVTLNSFQMNDSLSAKIHHLDCLCINTAPCKHITESAIIQWAASSSFYTEFTWSTRSNSDHNFYFWW